MNYLHHPCPRCKQFKLLPPVVSGEKTVVYCEGCKKTSGINKDGEVYALGRRGHGFVPVRRFVKKEHAEYTSAEFREALDAYERNDE